MNNEDLKIELIENGSPEITLTITHTHTGLTVFGSGSRRFILKDDLLNKLRSINLLILLFL
jgi:hypothetical protein